MQKMLKQHLVSTLSHKHVLKMNTTPLFRKSFSMAMYHNNVSPFEFGLGEKIISQLPDYFVKFHQGDATRQTVIEASGYLKVTRGSFIGNLLATIGGLPKACEKAHVTAQSIGHGWNRNFDGKELNSKWSIRNGMVVESFGIFNFGFDFIPIYRNNDPTSQPIGFEHRFRKMWIFGVVPIPKLLALDPSGTSVCLVEGQPPKSWHVEVNITNPIVGHICSYSGIMSM